MMDENMEINPQPEKKEPAATFQPYSYTPPPRYVFPMGKKEMLLALGILLFSLVLWNSLIYAGPNLGFALGAFGLVICSWVYLRSHGHRGDRYTGILLILCLVIIAAFPRSDDVILKLLMIVLLLMVPSLSYCLMAGRNIYRPDGILSLLDCPRTFFGMGFGRMSEAGRGIKEVCKSAGAAGKRGSSVLLGLLIAVPVVAVLVPMLMFADAAFEGLVNLLPELDMLEIVTTVSFGFCFGYVLYTRDTGLQHLPHLEQKPKIRMGLNAITVNTVLMAVAAVYTAYLVSQLAYFVGGFAGILPEEYTMAQYARRGFFEMAWLCAINLAIIAFSVGLVSAKGKVPVLTKLLCLFVGMVTLFLVTTASAKMFLYIDSYGLTRLRVLTEVFMIWLAMTTIAVCVWLFRSQVPYMKMAMTIGIAFCAVLMWADVDAQVAKYNVRAYQSGTLETVDVSHLGSLSYSAVPWLEELTHDKDPEISQMAKDILTRKARALQGTELGLRGWNGPEAKAREILAPYTDREAVERAENNQILTNVSDALNVYATEGMLPSVYPGGF